MSTRTAHESATADICTAPALELGRRIAVGEQTSVEITRALLDRIEAVEPAVHAFLSLDAERALARAAAVDAGIAAGEPAASPLTSTSPERKARKGRSRSVVGEWASSSV